MGRDAWDSARQPKGRCVCREDEKKCGTGSTERARDSVFLKDADECGRPPVFVSSTGPTGLTPGLLAGKPLPRLPHLQNKSLSGV
jgi:hypothetical protein